MAMDIQSIALLENIMKRLYITNTIKCTVIVENDFDIMDIDKAFDSMEIEDMQDINVVIEKLKKYKLY